jgi:hypothetical protein
MSTFTLQSRHIISQSRYHQVTRAQALLDRVDEELKKVCLGRIADMGAAVMMEIEAAFLTMITTVNDIEL